MNFLNFIVVSVTLTTILFTGGRCEIPEGSIVIGTTVTGKTLFIHPSPAIDFIDSLFTCVRYGANQIASFNAFDEEASLILAFFESTGEMSEKYWIGATNFGRTESTYSNGFYISSSTGEPVDGNWYPKQTVVPWRHCATVQYTTFASYSLWWFHTDCREPFQVICETRI